ncbi:hypothetical protein GCM10009579_01340 [Streptomyces javensis]|uniref:Alanine racemase N-terminal domain-containing protein n=1 Tax=Streptomyces javensis TaxID=114698 RepID=A0ABN1WGN3_9ACTN
MTTTPSTPAGTLADPDTPFAVVDVHKALRNIDRLAAKADHLGVVLRPHVKTAKTTDGGYTDVGADASRRAGIGIPAQIEIDCDGHPRARAAAAGSAAPVDGQPSGSCHRPERRVASRKSCGAYARRHRQTTAGTARGPRPSPRGQGLFPGPASGA